MLQFERRAGQKKILLINKFNFVKFVSPQIPHWSSTFQYKYCCLPVRTNWKDDLYLNILLRMRLRAPPVILWSHVSCIIIGWRGWACYAWWMRPTARPRNRSPGGLEPWARICTEHLLQYIIMPAHKWNITILLVWFFPHFKVGFL